MDCGDYVTINNLKLKMYNFRFWYGKINNESRVLNQFK